MIVGLRHRASPLLAGGAGKREDFLEEVTQE